MLQPLILSPGPESNPVKNSALTQGEKGAIN